MVSREGEITLKSVNDFSIFENFFQILTAVDMQISIFPSYFMTLKFAFTNSDFPLAFSSPRFH